jgi:hypothetical protein
MKLGYAVASPLVRKVVVTALELGLACRIGLMPTAVSPVQGNGQLALENSRLAAAER